MLTVLEQKDLFKNIYLKLLKDSVKEVKYQALLGFLEVIIYYFYFTISVIDHPLCCK